MQIKVKEQTIHQNRQHLQNQSFASWRGHIRDDLASRDSRLVSPINNIENSHRR